MVVFQAESKEEVGNKAEGAVESARWGLYVDIPDKESMVVAVADHHIVGYIFASDDIVLPGICPDARVYGNAWAADSVGIVCACVDFDGDTVEWWYRAVSDGGRVWNTVLYGRYADSGAIVLVCNIGAWSADIGGDSVRADIVCVHSDRQSEAIAYTLNLLKKL